MKIVTARSICTICSIGIFLAACQTTSETSSVTSQQTNHAARMSLDHGQQYAENAQRELHSEQQLVQHSHGPNEQTLTGLQSTHGRLLAAGGYIAGAIGGS